MTPAEQALKVQIRDLAARGLVFIAPDVLAALAANGMSRRDALDVLAWAQTVETMPGGQFIVWGLDTDCKPAALVVEVRGGVVVVAPYP